MRTRQLRWEDVHWEVSRRFSHFAGDGESVYHDWKNSKGETRLYARLNGLAEVGKEFWVPIMLELHKKLRKLIHKVKQYEVLEHAALSRDQGPQNGIEFDI